MIGKSCLVRRLARFSMSGEEGSKLPCLDPIQPMATEHLETNRNDRCSVTLLPLIDASRVLGGNVTPWHRKVHTAAASTHVLCCMSYEEERLWRWAHNARNGSTVWVEPRFRNSARHQVDCGVMMATNQCHDRARLWFFQRGWADDILL